MNQKELTKHYFMMISFQIDFFLVFPLDKLKES